MRIALAAAALLLLTACGTAAAEGNTTVSSIKWPDDIHMAEDGSYYTFLEGRRLCSEDATVFSEEQCEGLMERIEAMWELEQAPAGSSLQSRLPWWLLIIVLVPLGPMLLWKVWSATETRSPVAREEALSEEEPKPTATPAGVKPKAHKGSKLPEVRRGSLK